MDKVSDAHSGHTKYGSYNSYSSNAYPSDFSCLWKIFCFGEAVKPPLVLTQPW